MPQALLFDFFDVLVLRGSDSFRLTYFPDNPEKNRQVKQLQIDRETGIIDFDRFVSKLAAIGMVDRQIVLKHIDNYQPNIQLLKYIRNQLKPKYKIGMVSSTAGDRPYTILRSAALAMFDSIISSDKVTLADSETHIFRLAARSLRVKEQDCVYIGYLPSSCRAAEAAGMQTIWYWGIKQIEKMLD